LSAFVINPRASVTNKTVGDDSSIFFIASFTFFSAPPTKGERREDKDIACTFTESPSVLIIIFSFHQIGITALTKDLSVEKNKTLGFHPNIFYAVVFIGYFTL